MVKRWGRWLIPGIFGVTALFLMFQPANQPTTAPGWQQQAEAVARHQSRMLLEHPLERLLVSRIEIIELEDLGPGECTAGGTEVGRTFQAKLRVRGPFGLPYADVIVDCHGAARLN